METLDDYLQSYVEGDIEGALAVFASDPDVVCIGTGPGEILIGPDEIRRQIECDFTGFETASYEWKWHSMSARGNIAWVASELVLRTRLRKGGKEWNPSLRFTAVMERREDKWLIVQSHASLASTEPY